MKKIIPILLSSCLTLMFFACSKDAAQKPSSANCTGVDAKYNTAIKAIINTKCAVSGCHVSGGAPGNFSNFAGMKPYCTNGKVNDRVLVKKDMPTGGISLSSAEINALQCWLENGALEN